MMCDVRGVVHTLDYIHHASDECVVRWRRGETLIGLLQSDQSVHSSVQLSLSSLPPARQSVSAPLVTCLHCEGEEGRRHCEGGEADIVREGRGTL